MNAKMVSNGKTFLFGKNEKPKQYSFLFTQNRIKMMENTAEKKNSRSAKHTVQHEFCVRRTHLSQPKESADVS